MIPRGAKSLVSRKQRDQHGQHLGYCGAVLLDSKKSPEPKGTKGWVLGPSPLRIGGRWRTTARACPEDLNKLTHSRICGRLPVLVTLDELDVSSLQEILTSQKRLVRQYQRPLNWNMSDSSLTTRQLSKLLGAQLRTKKVPVDYALMEKAMLDIMYEVPFLWCRVMSHHRRYTG